MSFASPHPDVEIPNKSVFDALFDGITDADRAKTAAIFAPTGEELSYGELIDRAEGIAGALAARGIGKGDVVALLAPNHPAFLWTFHGILRSGATATTINALFTPTEIAKQLTDSRAKMLITVSLMAPQALEAAKQVGIADDSVVILDGEGAASGNPNALDLLGAGAPAPAVSFDPAEHLAVLPYSSGTTGNPKGVMLTHRNLVANVAQIDPIQGTTADDKVMAILPFFHIYGMTVLMNSSLLNRSTLIIMPKFDLVQFLESIQNHRATFAFIAPPVAVALAKHPLIDQYDLSSLRTIVSGAAPLDQELGQSVAKRLDITMLQGFGMSELSPVSHIIPADGGVAIAGTAVPLSSSGWPIANTENKLVDPQTGDEIPLPPAGSGIDVLSEPGELWVKGPNVMAGYLNNAEATAETLDADGYLHTGDIAQADSTGLVYIVDRLKELIKYKGYQVPPAELEALLLTHPKIADAAVVGAIEEGSGEEVPKAFIVAQPDAELTADEVIQFTAERVAPHKKVRQVAFIDAVPKSAAGKILRKELRGK
jgi:acyl-CoA synthetase (AMP-forming)/AMP-acid ligase II